MNITSSHLFEFSTSRKSLNLNYTACFFITLKTQLPKFRIAVAAVCRGGLIVELKAFDLGAEDQLRGLAVKLLMIGRDDLATAIGEFLFHFRQQAEPPLKPIGIRGRGDVLRQLTRLIDDERFKVHAQEAGPHPFGIADRYDRRQFVVRVAEHLRQVAAERRILHGTGRDVAGVKLIGRSRMLDRKSVV